MSFFSEIGSFLGDVQEFSEQVHTTKQQVVSSIVDTVDQGQQIVTQITDEVTSATQDVKQVVVDTAKETSQTLSETKN